MPSEESLLALLAERELEIRRLRVSHGRTFEELQALGAVGGGEPYRFEELVAISLVQPPSYDDTKRPPFFTGHIDLANDLLRYMPVRHLVITMLRDPVERIVSHFRYHSTRETTPLYAEIRAGLELPDYFRRFQSALPPQYEVFAPETTNATDALANLESKVSFFGLQDRFREFTTLLGGLAGLPDVSYRPLNVTSTAAVDVPQSQIDDLRSLLAEDVTFYQGACELYRRRLGDAVGHGSSHPWARFYAA